MVIDNGFWVHRERERERFYDLHAHTHIHTYIYIHIYRHVKIGFVPTKCCFFFESLYFQ